MKRILCQRIHMDKKSFGGAGVPIVGVLMANQCETACRSRR